MESVQVNAWLAAWGVIGPVLVAGISTWYNRRNQVDDRTFNTSTENARRTEERKIRFDDAEIADYDRALTWRRNTLIEFLSASFDFVWKGSGSQESEVRERHRERFTKAFATLSILDPAIATEACDLWEACIKINSVNVPEHAAAVEKLAEARGKFALKAHQLIAEQIVAKKEAIALARSADAPS